MQARKAEARELALGVVHPVDGHRCAVARGVARGVEVGQARAGPPLAAFHVHHGAGVGGGGHEVEQQVVGDELVAGGQGQLVAGPVWDLAHPQAGLQVTQRHRHRSLVHDRLAVGQCAGAAFGGQGQLEQGAAVGFFGKVDHRHAEVRVVVGVARVAVVQQHKRSVFVALVDDVGRVDLAGDLQAFEALVGEAVLHAFGLDGHAVEFTHLLRCHAPLASGGCCWRGCGLRAEPLLQLVDAVAQRFQFVQQFRIALGQGGECGHQGQGDGAWCEQLHGDLLQRSVLQKMRVGDRAGAVAAPQLCAAAAISRCRWRSARAMK